jgi:ferredoxin/flavodoxin---NADP+ reductase
MPPHRAPVRHRGREGEAMTLPAAPLRVAIVGSGPAGFYAAGALLRGDEPAVEVEMFDRLPTPWGLVRAGVAPDHPNIKAVSRVYEKTAADPGFRFFGNVEIGRDISHHELAAHCHAVIYAVGAQADRRMGIPGEDLPGSWAATEFVAWYNGHPDYAQLEFDLSVERAIVVGNGNVAADVARMLALSEAELARTDAADHAIEALARSSIREIVVLGRRGPAQAAFTNPELRELGEMTEADVVVDPAEVEPDELTRAHLESDDATLTVRRNMEILDEFSRRPPRDKPRRIILRFLCSPDEITGDGRVEALVARRNELVRAEDGSIRARATDRAETIPAGLVFRSIGYRGVRLEGLPFDERRAVVPNDGGRVLDPDSGEPVPGLYVTGWIKRGPTGIIGTNKKDAQETAAALVHDYSEGRLPEAAHPSREELECLVGERRPGYVSYAGWEAIDEDERRRGEPLARPRVKHSTFEALLAAARPPQPEEEDGAPEITYPSRGHAAVTRYLDEQGVSYQLVEHPPALTAAEQARAAQVDLDRTAKAIPLRDERGWHVAVIPASHRLDLDKARSALGAGPSLQIATFDQIRSELPAPDAGVLPPLAPLLRAPEVLDRRLLDHDGIFISGGDDRHVVLIDPNDLVEVVQPHVADISRD